MKFHVTMLCGGKSMMLTPSEKCEIDLEVAKTVVPDVIKCSKELLEFTYKEIKITLYPSGNVFFYHFTDRDRSFEYAKEILDLVS